MPPPSPGLSITHDHPSRQLSDARIRAGVRALVAGEGATVADLGIVLTDHDTVHRLNREYLSHDYRTDVLSFSLRSPADPTDADDGTVEIEGEVYVDLDTAAERCSEFDASFEEEALRYVLHGVLHLVGYEDATDASHAEMQSLEDRYLQAARPGA